MDTLMLDGESYSIAAEPMADYLQTARLPHPLVPHSTACWRGYFSAWSVDDERLYLIEWNGYIGDFEEVGMEYIFPGQEKVFAEWYSGEIRIPQGKLVCYIHGGYESIYEKDLFLKFEKGILKSRTIVRRTKEEIRRILKEEEENDLPF